jgi:ketosteroid isomerase-like protein
MGAGPPRGLTEDDLELVRTGYEAFNRHDVDALLGLLDDSIEFHLPLDPLGEQPVFRGRDGAREFYEIVFGGFEELRAEVAAIRAIGQVAVVTGRMHARAGGAPPTTFGFAHFWTVRDRRAVSVAFHDADNPLRLLEEGGGA